MSKLRRRSNDKHYLERFRDRGPELLKHVQPSAEYPFTVVRTWELSFEQVRREFPEAADLRKLLAFFAPDDVPRDILCEGAPQLPEALAAAACDQVRLDDILAVLRSYSLADVQPDGVSMHRLVQAVTRDLMSDEEKKIWAGAVVKLLSAAYSFDADDLSTWPPSQRLLPHGMAAAGHAEKLKVAAEETASLLNESGLHLQLLARLDEAKRGLECVLRIHETAFGPDHPDVATALSNLGLVLQDLGEIDVARIYLTRALEITRKVLGEDHSSTKKVRKHLAALDEDQ